MGDTEKNHFCLEDNYSVDYPGDERSWRICIKEALRPGRLGISIKKAFSLGSKKRPLCIEKLKGLRLAIDQREVFAGRQGTQIDRLCHVENGSYSQRAKKVSGVSGTGDTRETSLASVYHAGSAQAWLEMLVSLEIGLTKLDERHTEAPELDPQLWLPYRQLPCLCWLEL